MNIVLFEASELDRPLPKSDRRAVHVLTVLRRRVGDSFAAAIVDGPRGQATLTAIHPGGLELAFTWEPAATTASPLTLIVGLPRPQTARDILRDATTLGVAAIHFFRAEKSEPGYAQSTLWSSGEWRRHVLAGAEQAFDPRLPEITHGRALAEVVAGLPTGSTRVALDHYESSTPLSRLPSAAPAAALAVGAERGWSAAERELLRAHGFTLAHLGPRVLRTETACVAALALLRAKLGLM